MRQALHTTKNARTSNLPMHDSLPYEFCRSSASDDKINCHIALHKGWAIRNAMRYVLCAAGWQWTPKLHLALLGNSMQHLPLALLWPFWQPFSLALPHSLGLHCKDEHLPLQEVWRCCKRRTMGTLHRPLEHLWSALKLSRYGKNPIAASCLEVIR